MHDLLNWCSVSIRRCVCVCCEVSVRLVQGCRGSDRYLVMSHTVLLFSQATACNSSRHPLRPTGQASGQLSNYCGLPSFGPRCRLSSLALRGLQLHMTFVILTEAQLPSHSRSNISMSKMVMDYRVQCCTLLPV